MFNPAVSAPAGTRAPHMTFTSPDALGVKITSEIVLRFCPFWLTEFVSDVEVDGVIVELPPPLVK